MKKADPIIQHVVIRHMIVGTVTIIICIGFWFSRLDWDPEMRFWFARFELYVALLIMMDNWYSTSIDDEPEVRATRLSNLISQMPCSYTKARQLIDDSAELGYAQIRPGLSDHRIKIVMPTQKTIEIWEAYWDEAKAIMEDTGLVDLLVDDRLASEATGDRAPR